MESDLLHIIHQALRQHDDPRLSDVSIGGCYETSELIITMDNGHKFLIAESGIREIE